MQIFFLKIQTLRHLKYIKEKKYFKGNIYKRSGKASLTCTWKEIMQLLIRYCQISAIKMSDISLFMVTSTPQSGHWLLFTAPLTMTYSEWIRALLSSTPEYNRHGACMAINKLDVLVFQAYLQQYFLNFQWDGLKNIMFYWFQYALGLFPMIMCVFSRGKYHYFHPFQDHLIRIFKKNICDQIDHYTIPNYLSYNSIPVNGSAISLTVSSFCT